MPVTVVIGLQWGDEGKGKVVDALAQRAQMVVRFNGGPNAGHTVVLQGQRFALHHIPAGIFHPQAQCLVANGVVVDPHSLWEEITALEQAGVRLRGRLWVSPRCHLILPYHKALDRLYEEAKGATRTGTTGRGIGPTYADKVSYLGLRVGDLLQPALLRRRLEIGLRVKNPILTALGGEAQDPAALFHTLLSAGENLAPFIRETYPLIQQAIREGQEVIMEGANGALLDTDFGTYPYCTASPTTVGWAMVGAGVAPRHITRVIGVLKAYTTRVGGGPLPGELTDAAGEELRRAGGEFGTTTGRPRRCAWLSIPLARYTATLNGCHAIALTKLDVLDGLATIPVTVGYRLPSHATPVQADEPWDAELLAQVEPIYEMLPGWQTPIGGCHRWEDLPEMARRYVTSIEQAVGVPIMWLSVGSERDALIERNGMAM